MARIMQFILFSVNASELFFAGHFDGWYVCFLLS